MSDEVDRGYREGLEHALALCNAEINSCARRAGAIPNLDMVRNAIVRKLNALPKSPPDINQRAIQELTVAIDRLTARIASLEQSLQAASDEMAEEEEISNKLEQWTPTPPSGDT